LHRTMPDWSKTSILLQKVPHIVVELKSSGLIVAVLQIAPNCEQYRHNLCF